MSIIYDTTSVATNQFRNGFDPSRCDAGKCFGQHLYNLMTLKFISSSTDDLTEKYQAERELKICQRKLDYWRRHLKSPEQEAQITSRLKRRWSR